MNEREIFESIRKIEQSFDLNELHYPAWGVVRSTMVIVLRSRNTYHQKRKARTGESKKAVIRKKALFVYHAVSGLLRILLYKQKVVLILPFYRENKALDRYIEPVLNVRTDSLIFWRVRDYFRNTIEKQHQDNRIIAFHFIYSIVRRIKRISKLWEGRYKRISEFIWRNDSVRQLNFSAAEKDEITKVEEEYIFNYECMRNVKWILAKFVAGFVEVSRTRQINRIFNQIAKELSIPTIELQHGVIYPHHTAYNCEPLDSDPDYLFTFGDYWLSKIENTKNCIPVGYPYLERQLLSHRNNKSKRNTILLISQPYSFETLLKVGTLLKVSLDGKYSIVMKLHPVMNSSEYIERIEAEEIEVGESDHDIYSLIARSQLVIGMNSTAIIEALAFGCKTVVYDPDRERDRLPLEYMDAVIEEDNPELITGAALRLISAKTESKSNRRVGELMFKTNATDNMLSKLSSIILR